MAPTFGKKNYFERFGKKMEHSLHLKPQRSISKEERSKKKSKWWSNALQFLKWPREDCREEAVGRVTPRKSMLGPLYMTDGIGAQSSWKRRNTRGGGRMRSGPLVGVEFGRVGMPYMCLHDEVDCQDGNGDGISIGAPSWPIYLVT